MRQDEHVVEILKTIANASGEGMEDFKIIFIHGGLWYKMQMRNGCYSEVRRPDRTGFSRWSDRRKYNESLQQYNRRMLDQEASA
tara:strand:- start:80 stop:331 length:252 start_codon:yes stop_codon:yes gene_type:complete